MPNDFANHPFLPRGPRPLRRRCVELLPLRDKRLWALVIDVSERTGGILLCLCGADSFLVDV
jgi:hypothetical protein